MVTHVGAQAEVEGLCSCCKALGTVPGWGGSLVVAPVRADVASARSCPPQLHLSPSFGHLKLKAVLSVSLSSKEARTSLPGSEGDAAGEGHHTQAGQPTSPRLCSYFSFFFMRAEPSA